MSEMGISDLTVILKNYLSHIVYIDDEFKITWQVQEEVKKPSRGSRLTGSREKEYLDEKENSIKMGMEPFCLFVQKVYPNILLTPIQYNPDINYDCLYSHMKSARLLILDWSLSERMTAVNLLQEAEFLGQLRFCVIYTSRLADAKQEFIDHIPYVKEQGLETGMCRGKEYEYCRANHNIFLICEKDKFDFDMIIEALTEVFVFEIGYFAISFIDMISRLEGKIPYYLSKFAQPFDKLLFLQTNSDGLPLDDVYHNISDMVMNNIKTDIELNENVLKSIYYKQIELIEKLLKNDEKFSEQLKKSIGIIAANLSCQVQQKDILKRLTNDDYKEIITKAISTPNELYKGIDKASRLLCKKYANIMANDLLKDSGINEQSNTKLRKTLETMYYQQYEEKIKKVLPTCLMILIAPEQSYDINSLITSLKTVTYDENLRYFQDVFENCYDEQDDFMYLKKNNDKPMWNLLQNKLNAGDIIFNKNITAKKIEEYYLCMVPSCHLLRPKKVDGNILFIKGIVSSTYPKENLRHSEHLTILPDLETENKLLYVVWQFHNIVPIDLNKICTDEFKTYYRPYRLTYEYIRQIMGEFISFYSKSGVEELFIKSDNILYDLLTQRMSDIYE